MKVATHNGSFHADDTFALAALRRLYPQMEIVRTRDRQLMDSCDLRVDVGLGNDPATGDFDHHQAGGAGRRDNGVPYASFGLVWKRYGQQICGSPEVAARIDRGLVQMIDAHDNGMTLFESRVEGLRCVGADNVISSFNPVWDSFPDEQDYREAFEQALTVAGQILDRAVAMAQGSERAAQAVREAVAAAEDPRLILLEQSMPWREVVVSEAPQARLVLYPRPDGWALQTVPVELGDFTNRLDLPAEWAGLQAEQLSAVTGVEGAVFCHSKRFFAAAQSREAALALARLALAAG